MRADSKQEKAMRAYKNSRIYLYNRTQFITQMPHRFNTSQKQRNCLSITTLEVTASHLSFMVAFSVYRDHNCH